jgi:hypothetical protein
LESANTTAGLFGHDDFLKNFFTDMCFVDPSEKISVKELSDAYNRWCEGQGEQPAQGRTFNRMMEERGFERKQARLGGYSAKAWTGIRLKTHDELVAGLPDAGSEQDIQPSAGNLKRFPAGKAYLTAIIGSGVNVDRRIRA